jgi:hypothetical protein
VDAVFSLGILRHVGPVCLLFKNFNCREKNVISEIIENLCLVQILLVHETEAGSNL